MSNRNIARRTKAEIAFGGVDITKTIQPYLLSVSYTDNEEDEFRIETTSGCKTGWKM